MKWVEVLNQAVSWSDFDTASRLASPAAGLAAAEHARLVSDAALLRGVFASYYLQERLAEADRQRMLQWLASVTPSIAFREATPRKPLELSGARRSNPLPAPFEVELTTALLQFLATVSESALFRCVQRCQGVRRQASVSLLPPDIERRFAERAGLTALLMQPSGDQAWSQCDSLIFSQRGRRFCSKACSNANFAARKAQQDPQYFAEKQERYRSRQRQVDVPETAAPEGAFVYMD